MKNYILTLAISAILVGRASAQIEFAPIGATWYYTSMESMQVDMGFMKVTSTDTAVIDGRKVKILTKEYHSSSGVVTPQDTIFAYQTGDSVMFYLDGEFHLVYNFGLNAGDTMEIYNPNNKYCGENWMHGHIVITAIDTFEINGVKLKCLHNEKAADSKTGEYYGRFAEKFGALDGLFGCECLADAFGDGLLPGWLRCYEDSIIGHYQFGDVACDSLFVFDWEAYSRWEDSMHRVDIIDNVAFDVVSTYNQTEQTITVYIEDFCDLTVTIFDVNGIVVCSKEMESNVENFRMPRKGLYVLRIKTKTGEYSRKFVAY